MSVISDEEADADRDFRVARGLKRKRGYKQNSGLNFSGVGGGNGSVESVEIVSDVSVEDVDSDYLQFLREVSLGRAEVYDDSDDSDCDADPHYQFFLENLREDGNSYLLEIAAEDGSSVLIKYEEESREEECRLLDNSAFENIRTVRGREKKESRKTREAPSSRNAPCQLRADAPRFSNGISCKEEAESRPTTKNLLKGEGMETGRSLKGITSCRKSIPVFNNRVRVPVSCKPIRSSEKTICLGSGHSPNLKNHETKSDEIDEGYQWFLDCLEQRDDVIVFKPHDDKEFIYEKDEEGSSDPEIMIVDDSPFLDGNSTPFASSKAYHPVSVEESWDGIKTADQSQFRERLMEVLKSPYDANEYTDLWTKVNERKQMEGHREHRSGKVKGRNLPGPPGKSYLQHYRDLEQKINSVHDQHKKLQLLRAFFFWLENLVHEGHFRPWKDSLFLKELA